MTRVFEVFVGRFAKEKLTFMCNTYGIYYTRTWVYGISCAKARHILLVFTEKVSLTYLNVPLLSSIPLCRVWMLRMRRSSWRPQKRHWTLTHYRSTCLTLHHDTTSTGSIISMRGTIWQMLVSVDVCVCGGGGCSQCRTLLSMPNAPA